MCDPVIDPEFQELLPKLDPDEYSKLAASIVAEGCRDPIMTWRNIIVDGHNRREICLAEGRPFECREMKFADRTAAMEWMVLNQLGRRNLGTVDRAKLGVRLKNLLELQKTSGNHGVVNSPPGKSRDIAAEKAKVGGKTIDAMEKVMDSGGKALNAMVADKEVGIEAAAAVAALPAKERAATVKAGPEAVKQKAKQIREGGPPKDDPLGKWPEAIRPVFVESGIFKEMLNHLMNFQRLFTKATGAEGKGVFHPMLCGTALKHDHDSIVAMYRQLRFAVSSREPFNVCPWCRAGAKMKDCQYCKSGGWSTKHQFDKAPESMRKGL